MTQESASYVQVLAVLEVEASAAFLEREQTMNQSRKLFWPTIALAALGLVVTIACGGGGGGGGGSSTTTSSAISSFTSNPGSIPVSGTALLKMTFTGTGVITPGDISVMSGTPLAVTPTATTTYTLSATSSTSVQSTQTTTVTVIPTSSSGLVGTWYVQNSSTTAILTFLDASNFLFAQQATTDSEGQSGVEVGTYTWNYTTGSFNAVSTRCDTLGTWGITQPSPTSVTANGDVLTLTLGSSTTTATRLSPAASNLEGSWGWQDSTGTYVFAILDSSHWVYAQQGTADSSGQTGIQVGTYTWNASTGAWTDVITTNTMGNWGLSDPPPSTVTVSGETLTAVVNGTSISFPLIGLPTAMAAPSIVIQPQSQTVTLAQAATFTVTATGGEPLQYQWMKNGNSLATGTSSSYTTPVTTVDDNLSTYSVLVSNSVGQLQSSSATLCVSSTPVYGLSGFMPVISSPNDLTGIKFKFNVVENQTQSGIIIFGANRTASPSYSGPISYFMESDVYSWNITYPNDGCTTYPPLGVATNGEASLRQGIADYPYNAGYTTGIASGLATGDATKWPVQSYLVDDISNLYKTEADSQFNINGNDISVTIEKGSTVSDVTSCERCSRPLQPLTYRQWNVQIETPNNGTVNQIVVLPELYANYLDIYEVLHFYSEFLKLPGPYAVQYWDFQIRRDSYPVWVSITSFISDSNYDGNGLNYGIHVITANGQKRIEFTNQYGLSYIPANTTFSLQ